MENNNELNQNKFEPVRLREGVPQIEIQNDALPDDLPDSLWVDFSYGDDDEKRIRGGMETYVISPVTEQNLFSDKYLNCTGAIGIGRDKVSGKEIAFISHQDPEFILHKGKAERDAFIEDMKDILDDLRNRSEEGTIEVVLCGGNIDPADPASKKSVDYAQSIELLSTIIRDDLGFNPTVLQGPNSGAGAVDIRVLTQERKIHIGR